ncbi:MAG: hypothetical protein IPP57_19490 [Candidatus Obscuribacter sp.]|jgi:hypothetical protein|nr:hypothetical protein [Candidatus Obscuribacter sp.]MDQ5966454.1 hypothetical protein [Cyanobacteriota bacterium erpe_2018_sw_39hr_WHONDRS-SW48-000098_B_bin.30]MBK7837229.1 hypothetical protein [Candidatus Obscuribacter sp.]MBK9201912.1 hypothetical protein [Candidatus Obscuribacter sp.]MBK9620197.1 hypothetical protein [Candidatus Obscuribacter sp.]
MATKQSTDQVLWMADCYSLAKRFPNPHKWLALLEPVETTSAETLNPFHYWLWMEIWKAAQLSDKEQEVAVAAPTKGTTRSRSPDVATNCR